MVAEVGIQALNKQVSSTRQRSAAEAGQKTKVLDGSQQLTPPTMQEIHHDQTEHGRTTLQPQTPME